MKPLMFAISILMVLATACQRKEKVEDPNMSTIVVKRVQPEDDEILEEWVRVTDEEDIFGVDACHVEGEWSWRIAISVAEFIRKDPLESTLRQAIRQALASVPGVTTVEEEDREVWIIKGNPKGEELVRACSKALDSLASLTRKAVDDLQRCEEG